MLDAARSGLQRHDPNRPSSLRHVGNLIDTLFSPRRQVRTQLMDRIAALRNIEEALSAFEQGEVPLQTLENRVQGILRTYATEFESDGLRAFRAGGCPSVEGLVVVAEDRASARARIAELLEEPGSYEVHPVDE